MKIFLSWSKEKSKKLAEATKNFLQGMFRDSVSFWISSDSISYGSRHLIDINQALKECDKCIAFLTKDNYNSPWIMYETGAIAGKNDFNATYEKNTIVPIVFDEGLKEHKSLKELPLNQFQMLFYDKESFRKLIIQINEEVKEFSNIELLNNQFDLNWGYFNNQVSEILEYHAVHSEVSVTCDFLVDAFENYNFPIPSMGPIIRYDSGFETQQLYNILLNVVDKRFWIFGRKNKKLFSNENRNFFQNINRRSKNGFDFRCLFINPHKKTLLKKAQKGNDFEKRLNGCIYEARNMLNENNVTFDSVCRFYSCEREAEIIIVDNAIIYSHVLFDDDDLPKPFTNAPFYIVDIENALGKKYFQLFLDAWEESSSII